MAEKGDAGAPGANEPAKAMPKIDGLLLFNKFTFDDVVVHDLGLKRYINLTPTLIPHSGARYSGKKFGKYKMSFIERLINNMMRTENYTGKKVGTYGIVKEAFDIIESKAKKNPIQMLVDAVENSSPREEVTRLKFGGISVPKAVDIAPSRRVDIALRNICTGAVNASIKNKKSAARCLADEIMLAAKGDMNSHAIAKKEEIERIAGSAR